MNKGMSILFVFLIGFSVFIQTAYGDWAHKFVVYDGSSYVVSDHEVDKSLVDKKLGKVTKYSDREGTYRGNFSNHYPKGTAYYSIKDVAVSKAIAIKDQEDNYIQADYSGKYAGGKMDLQTIIPYVFGGIIVVLVFLMVQNSLRKKR